MWLHEEEERLYIWLCAKCRKKDRTLQIIHTYIESTIPNPPLPPGWQWFCVGSETKHILCTDCSVKYRQRIIDLRNEITSQNCV